MTGKELFGVVVRSAGFLVLLYGAWLFLFGMLMSLSPEFWLGTEHMSQQVEPSQYLASGAVLALGGIAIISAADVVVRLAYRPSVAEAPFEAPASSGNEPPA